jgi:hypothetical protein
MTNRWDSLKRGDRLSKKEWQTTASDWEKATNCDLCYGSKVTATFISIKQATKQLQNEWQATWVTPLMGLSNDTREKLRLNFHSMSVSELLEYGRLSLWNMDNLTNYISLHKFVQKEHLFVLQISRVILRIQWCFMYQVSRAVYKCHVLWYI